MTFRINEKHQNKNQLRRKKQQTKNAKLDLLFCAGEVLSEFSFPLSTGILALLR